MTRRLFLFAAYDRDGIIDACLLHYLTQLSTLGDIVFVMDNDASDFAIDKVKQIPNVLYATAERHGEYDFGSYKRAYMWARDNKILKKYDWVYLVNDSVYGPLFDLKPILEDLESRGADLTGMVSNSDDIIPRHIQSWFMGLNKQIATADFFDDFISNIQQCDNKEDIVLNYEFRLSNIIIQRGYKASAYSDSVYKDAGFLVYASPLHIVKAGIPFVKKASTANIAGINFLIPYTQDMQFLDLLIANAQRNNIKIRYKSGRFEYRKTFRFSFLSIPIFSVYRQDIRATKSYKVYIFGAIPVIKFTFHRRGV